MRDAELSRLDLAPDTEARFRQLASERQLSLAELIRIAIATYVERQKTLDEGVESALAAWNTYRADGVHVTGEEVDRWLARLEAGERAEAPECHR